MYNVIGRQDPPVITHPGFYYGFVGTAIAWQIGFLMIGRNPVTLRPVMIAAAVEKFTYSVAVIVLVAQSRMHPSDLPFGVTVGTPGPLFENGTFALLTAFLLMNLLVLLEVADRLSLKNDLEIAREIQQAMLPR